MSEVKSINSADFEATVVNSDRPTLVDFYADWCGPCKALAPKIEELAKEYTSAQFVKVNVDNNPDLASRFGVRGIPTLIVFNKGQVKETLVGNQPKDSIVKALGV